MSKYGNRITYVDGLRFDSVAEAAYYQRLKLYKLGGKVLGFERQAEFSLPGGIYYIADFVVWPETPIPAEWYVVDVKGVLTKEFRLKAKLFMERYPGNKLIIAKAIYGRGGIAGFDEYEFGKRRKVKP